MPLVMSPKHIGGDTSLIQQFDLGHVYGQHDRMALWLDDIEGRNIE